LHRRVHFITGGNTRFQKKGKEVPESFFGNDPEKGEGKGKTVASAPSWTRGRNRARQVARGEEN